MEERADEGVIFRPLFVHPVQFFGTAAICRIESSPHIRLRFAVLQEALMTLERTVGKTDPRSCRLVREVMEWIGLTDTGWPFSFVSICDLLGLDTKAVRAALLRYVAQEAGPGHPRRFHRYVHAGRLSRFEKGDHNERTRKN